MSPATLIDEPTPADLKRAFGSFATGVAVIGARGMNGEMAGMTANSLTSVSMNPPLVLFCPARSLAAFNVYKTAAYFSVSILGEQCEAVSNHFARSGIDKWKAIPHGIGPSGCPYLDNAIAVMECEVEAQHPAGDHLIVLGRVRRLMISAVGGPLIFFRSSYRHLDPASGPAATGEFAPFEAWG
jgi:flavin reductase (DIM6/NTAB) family NADH-FMN oxidoreductase RutF